MLLIENNGLNYTRRCSDAKAHRKTGRKSAIKRTGTARLLEVSGGSRGGVETAHLLGGRSHNAVGERETQLVVLLNNLYFKNIKRK